MRIIGKGYEFSFEEENMEAFKEGLQSFVSLVREFEKTPIKIASSSKRGGRRPPFIKNAILELIEKEPGWCIDKFPEDIANKLKTEYRVAGAKGDSVEVALIRLFKDGRLTRKEIQGKYAYSVPTIPK
jgi:hypothetical protein